MTIPFMDEQISSMDESAICGCHPWMEEHHPWMKVLSFDVIHKWRNLTQAMDEIQSRYQEGWQKRTFTGGLFRGYFNGIAHARNFARKHFGYSGDYNAAEKHSARAVAHGRGQRAFVQITKTDGVYKAQLIQHRKDQRELQLLQPLQLRHS